MELLLVWKGLLDRAVERDSSLEARVSMLSSAYFLGFFLLRSNTAEIGRSLSLDAQPVPALILLDFFNISVSNLSSLLTLELSLEVI